MGDRLDTTVLRDAAQRAEAFFNALDERGVAATARYEELRERLARPLAGEGVPSRQVFRELMKDMEGGLLGAGGPRFFGWVIGGSLPAAIAADWMVSTWDQNGAIYQTSPASGVAEEVAGEWLKDVLGLPMESSFAVVTGCQMAHFTALAAARHALLARRGIDVERQGLYGAPPVRVLTGPHRHESLLRALRFLGMGSDAIEELALDGDGRLDPTAVRSALDSEPDRPTVICAMAGDLNTGAADPFNEICDLAEAAGAWVHVDGAFGLWVNASPTHRHMLAGVERADSWATDGHKWLQLPFDHGFAFVKDPAAHRAAMSMRASYFIAADGAGREQMDWNPEWSRRPRGVVTYAALRSLGRDGVADVVDTCCRLADRIVSEVGALEGAEVLAPARMNQGLLRFLDPDGDHDARTDAVIEAIRAEGTAWFGGTEWNGKRAMRVSVCNHRTTDRDVDLTVDGVARVLRSFG